MFRPSNILSELSSDEKKKLKQVLQLVNQDRIQDAIKLADTLSSEAKNLIPDSILFKFSIAEMSGTGGGAGASGASMAAGTGEQYGTAKAFKPKKKTKLESIINEISYGKFKTESKTRTKTEAIHKAVKEVKKRVKEINKLMEYTGRMKSELSEGEDNIQYSKFTERAIDQISEMVQDLNNNVKKLKQ